MQSILSTSQEELKTFLQDTKYEVEQLSRSKPQRQNVKKELFKEQQIRLQGLSLLDSNLEALK